MKQTVIYAFYDSKRESPFHKMYKLVNIGSNFEVTKNVIEIVKPGFSIQDSAILICIQYLLYGILYIN